MARLSREFYEGGTVDIARRLLGSYLVRRLEGETLVCRLTETEAYVGRCDRACHAYGYHKTPRNAVMFGPPGHAYLYFVYGMHHCLNLVTEPEGEPSAVLIRGGEVIHGLDTVCRLRFGRPWDALTAYQRKNLLNGPGKLCKGLSLSTAENGMDLTGGTLFVCQHPADAGRSCPDPVGRERICAGPRIGVDYAGADKDLPWRFWLEKED